MASMALKRREESVTTIIEDAKKEAQAEVDAGIIEDTSRSAYIAGILAAKLAHANHKLNHLALYAETLLGVEVVDGAGK